MLIGLLFVRSFSLGSYMHQVTFCFNKWFIVVLPVIVVRKPSELLLRHLASKPLAWIARSKMASLDLASQIHRRYSKAKGSGRYGELHEGTGVHVKCTQNVITRNHGLITRTGY